MHEMSIAIALLEQIEAHIPAGATLRHVYVRAGAMQAIEPEAMRWAWRALTDATCHDGADLHVTIEPYRLHCDQCGHEWNSPNLFAECRCGCPSPRSVSSSGITLLSLTVDEPNQQECML